jgi:hypothetical protein
MEVDGRWTPPAGPAGTALDSSNRTTIIYQELPRDDRLDIGMIFFTINLQFIPQAKVLAPFCFGTI